MSLPAPASMRATLRRLAGSSSNLASGTSQSGSNASISVPHSPVLRPYSTLPASSSSSGFQSPLTISPFPSRPSSPSPRSPLTGTATTSGQQSRATSSSSALDAKSQLAGLAKIQEAVKKGVEEHRAAAQFEGVPEGGLRVLIFGKPGSGKGTLSARMIQKYDLAFLSTGDLLRREIADGTEIGKKAEQIVASGGLVSDEMMLDIIQLELDKMHGRSFVIDGFPRTLHQAALLDAALSARGQPINLVLHLSVPDSVILKRISARWIHLPSGRVYNTDFPSSRPKKEGLDDVTGEPLTKRPDDNPEVFRRRLDAFYNSTSPLLDYFASKHPAALHNLHGSTSDEVRDSLSSTFNYYSPDSDLSLAAAPSDNITGVEKIWPQIEAILDGYGVQKRSPIKKADEVEEVKREADDYNVDMKVAADVKP